MTTPPERTGLARTLAALVEAHPSSLREIAARAGSSPAALSRYTSGRNLPPEGKLRRILDALGVDDEQRAELLALREHLRAGYASRTVLQRGGFAELQKRWGAFETESEHLQSFVLQIIPWTLQTPEYIRAILEDAGASPETIDGNIAARVARQDLVGDPEHRFTDVLFEGALRWHVKSPELMIEQLAVVADRCRTGGDRVRVGVIPWTQPLTVFPQTTFHLYDDRVVIIGTGAGTTVHDKPGDVQPFVERFAQLCEVAVWGEDAAREVERIRDEYRALRDT